MRILLLLISLNAFGKIDPELIPIQHIETACGKYMNHKNMKNGMHSGDSAGGTTGIMPLTAKFIIKKIGKYTHVLTWSHSKITDELNGNRAFEYDIANAYWKYIRSKYPKNVYKAAYSWFNGPAAIEKRKLKLKEIMDHFYVLRYKKYENKVCKVEI